MIPVTVEIEQLCPELREKLAPLLSELGTPQITLSCNRHAGCEVEDGKGVDLICKAARDYYRLTKLALRHGFDRIGLYPGFIHLDVHEHRPKPVLWVGKRAQREED